ncbi:MAG: NAD(P)-dependent glycerol-3-phosphate dehydrogenase [Dehalococcoidia bacterium]|nr:NAD(P)-dependent glycerol-3-phosphate dehydrogenase [Dehalococcoidia bacterium]
MAKIGVIGTTSWGITLAVLLARNKYAVKLWARSEGEAQRLRTKGSSSPALEGIVFPTNLEVTSSLKDATLLSSAVILAVPSQTMRQNMRLLKDHLKSFRLIISASKGLEMGSNKRMSQVIADEIGESYRKNICVLSGPNLAREIACGLPAAAVVTATNEEVARKAQKLLTAPNFTVYTNHDLVGVELGGTLKNIIALGAGMIDGLGYGDNAKAAFITRGLTEMTAFSLALGANPLTLSGLAGLGDLIATCASPLSRNHYVGAELARGKKLSDITHGMDGVAEGITTTSAVWDQACKLRLEMPITQHIYQVLYNGARVGDAIAEVLGASYKHELAGKQWRLFSFLGKKGR